MTKQQALELADIAYTLLRGSYGLSAIDSGDMENMANILLKYNKVKEWMPYMPDNNDDEGKDMLRRFGINIEEEE